MLRDAVPDDHPALRSIFRRASLSNEGDRPLLLANPEHLEWREPTGSEAFRVRVAVTADAVIAGFATLVISPADAELDDLFVDPSFMRCGIGLALVGDAARLAQRGRLFGARRDRQPTRRSVLRRGRFRRLRDDQDAARRRHPTPFASHRSALRLASSLPRRPSLFGPDGGTTAPRPNQEAHADEDNRAVSRFAKGQHVELYPTGGRPPPSHLGRRRNWWSARGRCVPCSRHWLHEAAPGRRYFEHGVLNRAEVTPGRRFGALR